MQLETYTWPPKSMKQKVTSETNLRKKETKGTKHLRKKREIVSIIEIASQIIF